MEKFKVALTLYIREISKFFFNSSRMCRGCVTGSFVLDHHIVYLQHSRAFCSTSFPPETLSIQIELIYFFSNWFEKCAFIFYSVTWLTGFFLLPPMAPRPHTGYLRNYRPLISSYLISSKFDLTLYQRLVVRRTEKLCRKFSYCNEF